MNKVILIGRLIADANLIFTAGKGTALATYKIAVDSGFGDNKKTAFIECKTWGKGAESLANYTHKGSKILVQGILETGSYENKAGVKVYTTTVTTDMFNGVTFLDSKGSATTNNSSNSNSFEEDMTPVSDDCMPF